MSACEKERCEENSTTHTLQSRKGWVGLGVLMMVMMMMMGRGLVSLVQFSLGGVVVVVVVCEQARCALRTWK